MTQVLSIEVSQSLHHFPEPHFSHVLHLDLKPENLLFRTPAEEADIMIADFGLSRIMEEEKLNQLTEICGTPGVCPFCCALSPFFSEDLCSTWLQRFSKRVGFHATHTDERLNPDMLILSSNSGPWETR